MTPTAEELWSDVNFIEKRLCQQIEVLYMYNNKVFYSEERRNEVIESTKVILSRFYYRLKQLNAERHAPFQRFIHSSYGNGKAAINFFCPPSLPGGEEAYAK